MFNLSDRQSSEYGMRQEFSLCEIYYDVFDIFVLKNLCFA